MDCSSAKLCGEFTSRSHRDLPRLAVIEIVNFAAEAADDLREYQTQNLMGFEMKTIKTSKIRDDIDCIHH